MRNKFFYISFILFLFCIPFKKNLNLIKKEFIHVVIDAGSSGTRFCPYKIIKNSNCELSTTGNICFSVPSRNGLANLNKEEIYKTLNEGFMILDKKYQYIDYVSLLGTGGFRQLSEEEQKEKYKIIQEYFSVFTTPYQIEFISGEKEAYFAWKSLALVFRSREHISLETGGATIQIGIGNDNFSYISFPAGMNKSYQKLVSNKEFKKCLYGNILHSKEYDECKEIVKKLIFENKDVKQFIKNHKKKFQSYKTYTLGKPWFSIFGFFNQDKISLQELEHKGKEICSLQPPKNIENNQTISDKTCYLFYFHQAEIETLGIKQIFKGIETWTISASLHALPFCN